MIKKGKREDEPPKGVKGEHPMTNSNHASEEDKVSEYSPDEVQGIKKELAGLQGDALYRRTSDLVNEGKLGPDDWHVIDYQGIYERLMHEQFDILKLKTLNARWRIAMGLATKSAIRGTGDADLNPASWFVKSEFKPHLCATDYLRVYPHVITEYTSGVGTPSQFLGNRWAKDAGGIIKSHLEQYGSTSPRQINEAVEATCNLTRITDPDKMSLPLDLTMQLPDHVIPINDGLFDLHNKTVTPHSPEYFYTESLPRKYVNGASPETFLKFLNIVFTGDPDAEIKKTQIFETIAWTLMRNYSIQGTVIFYGQGGEGKSIIHDVIASLLVHVSTISLAELENDKFKRAELYGSSANLISESTTNIITSEWFKRLTDGTQITVDRKNGHPFKMRSHAKMIIDTNELPVKENELRAFYRRVIVIIDFPNMLESMLTPEQINDYVTKMKDPDELNRIFSFVVDNYYGPLVQRMKFTAHLSIADAEKKWQERSNPGMTFLQLKQETGLIFTDVEDAKTEMSRRGIDSKAYLSHEKEGGDEYLITAKQTLIQEAIKWASNQGFPAKAINTSTMGHSISQLGYQNVTADKKLSNNTKIKAWRDICILPFDDDESRIDEKPPRLQETPQEILGEKKSLVSTPIPAHVCAHAHVWGYRKVSGTKSSSSLENTASNLVSGDYGRFGTEPGLLTKNDTIKPSETPVPDAIPDKNPITLDQGKDMSETHENPKFYTYVVLKDFKYNGHVYSQGIEFIPREKLTDYVNEGILMLKEGPA